MRPAIKLHLVKLAAYYEKTLSPEQIQIYSEQLAQNLTDSECFQACRLYVDDPKNEFFPRPVSKLIALIKTPVAREDVAQNVSSLLMAAERKYGVHWAEGFFQENEIVYEGKDMAYRTWRAAALSVFGKTGLAVVDRYGGWKNFCLNIYESPDGVVRAQIKGLAQSLETIVHKTGSYDSLPLGSRVEGLTQANNVLDFKKKDT